jgi:site-specific recombinase XerD
MLIAAYLDAESSRWASQTARVYAADLRTYAQWLRSERRRESPLALREHVYDANRYVRATQARKHAVLSRFYRWAAERGDRAPEYSLVLDQPTFQWRRRRAGPPRAALDAVLAVIPDARRRDRVLFRLMMTAGLRVGDVQYLSVSDVQPVKGGYEIALARPKAAITIQVREPETVTDLTAYLAEFHDLQGPLFPAQWNGRGGPIGQRTIHGLWRGYAAQTGLPDSPQQLHNHYLSQQQRAGDKAGDPEDPEAQDKRQVGDATPTTCP